jgi:hypothetical protein
LTLRKRTLTILLVIMALAATWQTSCTGEQPAAKRCGPVTPPALPAPPANVNGTLIVTDISGSMQGFALPGSARLYTVHDTLEKSVRNATASSEPTPRIQRCYLGKTLDCRSQLQLNAMDVASTYAADESRLDLFLTAAPPADAKDKAAKPVDPIEPYRVAVLVTDGMAARAPNAPAGGSPCLAGADPECMAYLLKQRAEQGYGIWVALLLLPFRGTHYAERPLDEPMWQRVQQHVAGLKQDEYFKGVQSNVKRNGSAVPFNSYQFEGVKPILVIALSRDIQAGRNFIQQFSEGIRREQIVQPSTAVYSMEVAPLSVRPRQITKVSLGSGQSEGVRPIAGKRQTGLYDYLVECDRNGGASFNVNWEEKADAPKVVPDGITVNYNLVPAGGTGNLPQGLITPQASSETGIPVQLSCRQLAEGNYSGCYDVQAELKVDPSVEAFWKALSADNIYEAPERLYGLREMIQQVLSTVTAQPRVMDRAVFRVERK